MARSVFFAPTLFVTMVLISCGGGGSDSDTPAIPASVSISPIDIPSVDGSTPVTFVRVGSQRQFTADVQNIANKSVVWSFVVAPGSTTTWSLDQNGVVTAPAGSPWLSGADLKATAVDGYSGVRYLEASPVLTFRQHSYIDVSTDQLVLEITPEQASNNPRNPLTVYIKSYSIESTSNTTIINSQLVGGNSVYKFNMIRPLANQTCNVALKFIAHDGASYDVSFSYTNR